MSDYIVSARKYRPQSFKTVVGQKALVQTLKNAIATGKLAHAYLFCGPRGVGKTTCARIFAKTINCEHLTPEGEACGTCESCQSFDEQRSYNVYELDAASNNGVDQIRDLIDQVQVPPQIGKYKVFIIDEVHMLSTAAFNAFLKTLEEPPRHAIFVMCTTEKQKILPTILSRCQTYDFQRITVQDIVDQLQRIAQEENIKTEPQALQVIARKADGGMRDALSVFDQIVSFTDGNVTYQSAIDNLNILDYELFFRLTDAALQGNIPAALLMLDEVIRRGFDAQTFIGGWGSHLRDLMVAQDVATLSLVEAGPEVVRQYEEQAKRCTPAFLYHSLQIASECDFNYRNSRNKRLSVELAIVKICQLLHPAQLPQQAVAPQPVAQQAPQQPVRQAVPQQPVRPMAAPQQPVARPVQQPMQQPAPRPVQQPIQQPAPQPVRQVRTIDPNNRFAGGSRLASMHGTAPQQQSQAPTRQLPEMNDPVTPDALRRAWKQYISTIPTEKLLMNTMVSFPPEWVEGTQYKITVASEAQQVIFMRHQADILRYLCNVLQNSHLQLECFVSAETAARQAFSPREKLQEMIKDNPAIETLIQKFGLEIG